MANAFPRKSPTRFLGAWTRFWHEPVRAERLALTRILLALCLLAQQLSEYLPNFAHFFGPEGVAPAGLHDASRLVRWYWTPVFFHTDDLRVLYAVFTLWVVCTIAFLFGWHTRLMSVAVWLLTLCFLNRNPGLTTGSDDVLRVGLFFLVLSPCGLALSLDSRRLRRRGRLAPRPAYTPAWPLRLLQVQLCMIYLSTGLAKLKADDWNFEGNWWDGTAIHYVLNLVNMSRWSFAQLPLPFWMTAAATYVSVWWETLFTPLVLCRWTRKWTLWFGVLFHLGIWLTIEVGWFSFYTLCLYAVWIPDSFWRTWAKPRCESSSPGG
jgi:hypothetical protein